VILGLLHRFPSVSWRFDSSSPQDHQTLSGSLSPKVFSRFSFDFFDLLLSGSLSPKVFSRFSFDLFVLLLNFINARSLYLGGPLGCHCLALNLV
jgi:hypothetical protein